MFRPSDLYIIIGFIIIFIGIMFFGVVHGQNSTNSTSEMLYGDKWDCGYINATTTLENLRDCFRD